MELRKIVGVFAVLLLLQLAPVGADVNPGSQTITGNTGEMKLASITYTNTGSENELVEVELFGLSSYVTPLVSSVEVDAGSSYTFYFICTIPSSTVEGVVIFRDNDGNVMDMATMKLQPQTQDTGTGILSVSYPDAVAVGENAEFVIKDASTGSAIEYGTLVVNEPVSLLKSFSNGHVSLLVTQEGYWSGSISVENYRAFNWVFVASGTAKTTTSSSVSRIRITPSTPVRGEFAYVEVLDDNGNLASGVTVYAAGMQISNPGSFVVPEISQITVVVKRGDEVLLSETYPTTSPEPERPQQTVEVVRSDTGPLLWAFVGLCVAFAVFVVYYFKPEWIHRILRRHEEFPR